MEAALEHRWLGNMEADLVVGSLKRPRTPTEDSSLEGRDVKTMRLEMSIPESGPVDNALSPLAAYELELEAGATQHTSDVPSRVVRRPKRKFRFGI